MKHYLTTLTLLCGLLGIAPGAYAQSDYRIDGDAALTVVLRGTSTLHDWQMEATAVTGSAEPVFATDDGQELTALDALSFSLAVEDLRSENKVLDQNAYKALNADTYERISYVLTSATVFPDAEGYLVKSTGQLTIAGTTRDIDMDVLLDVTPSGTITCRGSYTLKMTDYDVTPPSFLLGMMKSGDDMTLEFAVIYQKSPGA